MRRVGDRHPNLVALGVAIVLTACHSGSSGGSGGSGPVTAPSPISSQPPTVNICCAIWDGQASYAGGGSGLWQFPAMTQTGAQINTGMSFFDHSGLFVGTISGNSMSFNFSYGNGGQGCGNALSGTATIGLTAMTGTFSGHDCAGQAVNGGTMSATIRNFSGGGPPLRTQAFAVGGTWVSSTGTSGGGTWTFQLSEQVTDFSASVLTGSATVSGNDRLRLGSATVTGSAANTFPGPTTVVTLNVSFTGACPSTLQLPVTLINNGSALVPGTGQVATGSMCDGSTPITFALRKQ